MSRTLRSLPRISKPRPLIQRRSHSTSVDPAEISHFNALAAEWWDPYGSSRLLHLMNPLRLQFLQSCLLRGSSNSPTPSAYIYIDLVAAVQGNENPRKLRYLDVGCGGGILAEGLARLKSTEIVVGIDPTPQVLKIAMEHMRQDPALKGKLRYLNTTVDRLEETMAIRIPNAEDKVGVLREEQEKVWKDGVGLFDVVTTMEVIEHVPNSMLFLQQCMAHVKPGGWVVGSTIARTWTSYLVTKLVAEDILNIVPRGTHDWNKYVNADELRSFFKTQSGWGGRSGEHIVFMGCIYVPGFGWREVRNGEKVGNYFFGIRRNIEG